MNNENNPFKLVHELGVISADTTRKLMQLDAKEKYVLHKLEVIDPAGVAADDTNYLKVQALLGSTVVAEWSTKLTGGEGALGADAWAKAPELKVLLEAGASAQSLSLKVDVTGTGALGALSRAVLTLSKV